LLVNKGKDAVSVLVDGGIVFLRCHAKLTV
jgi:hypothetical protein